MGYDGHELEVYLVRLLFCLFADDTSIFERRQFQDLIEQRTAEDGQDLAQWLGHLFEVLNTPPEKRLKRLDEQLANFRYVIHKSSSTLSLDVGQFNILCDVDQFYGIEIEEFPAQIAQTALWLMDHQMNMRVSEEFGNYFVRLPLKKSAKIVHGNALQQDWREVIKPAEINYIFGNPPFGGKQYQNEEQKADLALRKPKPIRGQ